MKGSALRIWFLIGLIPLIVILLYLSRGVLTPFIFAFFLAYTINPLVEFLQTKGARRGHAVLTVYLVIFLLVALIILLIVPRLIADLTRITQRLPEIFTDFQKMQERWIHVYLRLPVEFQTLIDEFIQRIELLFKNYLFLVAKGLLNCLSQVLVMILVPLLAYYISRDYPQIKIQSYGWISRHLGNHWTRTFLKLDTVFKLYIRGQLLDTLVVGMLIGLGLAFMGFDAAFLLGIAAGILNLIPYFGPVLGALPAIAFGLLHSPWMAGYVVILFAIVNQLEVMILSPRLIGVNLGIHPVFVIYLILVGGQAFGLVGMIFAVPLGTIGYVLFKSLYEICFGLANEEPISGELDLMKTKLD